MSLHEVFQRTCVPFRREDALMKARQVALIGTAALTAVAASLLLVAALAAETELAFTIPRSLWQWISMSIPTSRAKVYTRW